MKSIDKNFNTGDLVTVKNHPADERFCIIGFKTNSNNEQIAILKALYHDTHIIEKPVKELTTLLIKGNL